MTRFVLTLVVLASILPPAWGEAQDQTAAPPEGASEDGVRWALGLGVISAPRPYVGASNTLMPIPLVELYYKRVYVQGIRFGYHILKTEKLTLDARFDTVFAGLDPEDSEFLAGMSERKGTLFGGLGADWALGTFELSLSAMTDVLGRSDGQEVSLDLSRGWTFGKARWGLTPSVGVVWQSSKLVDYYFGVRPEEALPGRPAFEGQSAFNLQAGVLAFVRLTEKISLVGLVRWQRLDNEIGDSPIVDQPRGVFGLAGITYRIGSERFRAP